MNQKDHKIMPVKNKISAVILSCFSLLTVSPAQAQSCKVDSIKMSSPDIRFVDNHDGTVTDKQTGLMWEKCPTGLSGEDCKTGRVLQYNWQKTLQQVSIVNQELELAGHDDWRLPNRKELSSLIEYSCYSPAINYTLFPNTKSTYYWTSSPVADTPDSSWTINFKYGVTKPYSRRNAAPFRMVRDG